MKVLIIRFSSIGDIVLTTPVVRCLKKQLNAEIHYLTKQSYQSVIKANPYIDKVITIQKRVQEVLPQLQSNQYDCIVDLHNNLRSGQVKRTLTCQHFTFDKINWQKWLMVNFKINRLPKIHIVDRYLATIEPLEVRNDGEGLDYFIDPKDEIELPSDLIPFQPYNYIALVIGAAHQTKRLPTNKIISICKRINQPIVLLGGPEESDQGNLIAHESGVHVINSCGHLKLNQSASIVKQSAKVITHDTGLMHIAAAFQKPIFSVWGNTIPAFGMYPYYPKGINLNTTFEVTKLSCRPCSKIGYQKCPKGHFKCMMNIDEEGLISKI